MCATEEAQPKIATTCYHPTQQSPASKIEFAFHYMFMKLYNTHIYHT